MIKKTLPEKAGYFVNAAIVAVALLLALALLRRFAFPDPPQPPGRSDVKVGSKMALAGVDWPKSNSHLVLILQKGCRFCDESAQFYQRLAEESAGHADLQLLAVLPQPAGEAREYLESLGVSIKEVRQASLPSIGISGTPTILLVDNFGTIKEAWPGKLSSAREEEVVRRIRAK